MVLTLAVLALVVAGIVVSLTTRGRVKHRLEKLLSDRFDSGVEIGGLSLSFFPIASVGVTDIKMRYHHRTDVPPMITIGRIDATSDLASLIFGAQHDVTVVRLNGLHITIAAGTMHRQQFQRQDASPGQNKGQQGDHLPFVIHTLIADGTKLTILPKVQGRDPLDWDIEKLTMHSVSARQDMEFIAILINAKPPGRIQTTGHFGPWQKEGPGGTPVSGHYTFSNADMAAFKGLSGKLHSVGDYDGSLDHINVNGTTDIPDFQVGDGAPVDLKTKFSATVDGTNGDTLLHPVDATFLNSRFLCQGGIVATPGIKGKSINLDAVATRARIEDILRLVMPSKKKNEKPLLTGDIRFNSKLIIPQGDVPVIQKLYLNGRFGLDSAQFTSDKVQDKLDLMSNRSRGLKGERRADNVASNLKGRFVLKNSVVRFSSLSFDVPGIWVTLGGTYGLRSEKIDFKGHVQLQGKVSQMTTGWKSLLLKAADPFFKKNGKRTVLPVKITGTKSDPKFGL
jgi:uncharacterized protein involved in outer membrane biogenesis